MYLDVDPQTAADLKRLEVDCSKEVGDGTRLEASGPVLLFTIKLDRDCYIVGARKLLGDELVDRLLELEPKAELRVVAREPRFAELAEP